MEDSDSYENHVIELRGDDQATSYPREEPAAQDTFQTSLPSSNKAVNGREDVEDDARADKGDAAPPAPEISGFRGTARVRARLAAKAQEAAEKERAEQPVGGGGKVRVRGRGSSKEEDEEGLGAMASSKELIGRVVWAKLGRFPWWPAQVIDPSIADDSLMKERASATDVLVRFFGTYDFAWVDPVHSLSDLDTKFQDRSKQRKKTFQKALEEVLEFQKSGTLPVDWAILSPGVSPKGKGRKLEDAEGGEGDASTRAATEAASGEDGGSESAKRSLRNGREAMASHNGEKDGEGVSMGRRTKAKKRGKSEATGSPQAHEDRRIRIMRHLGLSPPPGSPFAPSSAALS